MLDRPNRRRQSKFHETRTPSPTTTFHVCRRTVPVQVQDSENEWWFRQILDEWKPSSQTRCEPHLNIFCLFPSWSCLVSMIQLSTTCCWGRYVTPQGSRFMTPPVVDRWWWAGIQLPLKISFRVVCVSPLLLTDQGSAARRFYWWLCWARLHLVRWRCVGLHRRSRSRGTMRRRYPGVHRAKSTRHFLFKFCLVTFFIQNLNNIWTIV